VESLLDGEDGVAIARDVDRRGGETGGVVEVGVVGSVVPRVGVGFPRPRDVNVEGDVADALDGEIGPRFERKSKVRSLLGVGSRGGPDPFAPATFTTLPFPSGEGGGNAFPAPGTTPIGEGGGIGNSYGYAGTSSSSPLSLSSATAFASSPSFSFKYGNALFSLSLPLPFLSLPSLSSELPPSAMIPIAILAYAPPARVGKENDGSGDVTRGGGLVIFAREGGIGRE